MDWLVYVYRITTDNVGEIQVKQRGVLSLPNKEEAERVAKKSRKTGRIGNTPYRMVALVREQGEPEPSPDEVKKLAE